jgi:hypothetical protein
MEPFEIIVDLVEDFTYEQLLDAAADHCRGKRMTQEEWDHHRELWAGLGVVLAPCAPVDNQDSIMDNNTDYNRAMKGL